MRQKENDFEDLLCASESYRIYENETGIKALTLSKMTSNYEYNFSRKDIKKFLICFDCQPNDLFPLIKKE